MESPMDRFINVALLANPSTRSGEPQTKTDSSLNERYWNGQKINSAHSKFKYCVLKKTEYCQCDSNQKCSPNPIEKSKANTFAKATLEKALGFLLKQCDAVGFEDCSTSVENKQPRVIQTGGHEDFDGYFPSGPRTTKESNPKSATTSTTTSTTSPVVSSFSPSFIDDNVGQSTVATVSEIIPQNIIKLSRFNN
ncbi:unnamed protein product [Lepeophtheirus salmonis]|uniref:(salmon louse) hypothetical protein n=1 Tax=Lepeophtheirus salmonis TaxID=72036 RepID=A0A7R8D7R6_LEPSM|nr:unnamed protein product [Lepeophtheirus salmonis]CAF3028015.1 unnamed protein product [Lepeophtheirus salmonis]